jgi:hypothetical protein
MEADVARSQSCSILNAVAAFTYYLYMQSKKSYHSLYQKILNWKSQKHDLPRLLSKRKSS